MASFYDPSQDVEKTQHNLTHWQQGETWIFLTWRLADSLPKAKVDSWAQNREIWLKHHPKPWDEATEAAYHERFSDKIDEWLDAGSGSCLLRRPENARIVADALRHFDGERYRLASFVVMPNHVHVLFAPAPGLKLPDLVHSWKRYSARQINLREKRSGKLWQEDYWDRLIRGSDHFSWVMKYIAKNPVKLVPGCFLLWP